MEYDKEIIQEITSRFKNGKVLDLGCGQGNESLYLASKGFDVTCVDINKKHIKEINEKTKKKGLKINAFVQDLKDFKTTESFDIILSIASFHFIEKKYGLNLIKNIKEVTSSKGINIIVAFRDSDPTFEDEEDCYFSDDELKKLYSDWTIEEYEEYDDYDAEEEQTNKVAYIVAKK